MDSTGPSRRAVFLDRDDTLIANREATAATTHPGDLVDPASVRLLPGVAQGLIELRCAGWMLVVVSNQGCVARGVCGTAQVDAVNTRMTELVRSESGGGFHFDLMLYCPHHPKGTVAPYNSEHEWRKPRPGMLLEAASRLSLDLPACWMIGDSERDAQAAVSAGIPPGQIVLVGDDSPFASAVRRVLADSPSAAGAQ